MREANNNLKAEGYDVDYISEIDNITLAHKRDMTYDFFLKHFMSASEWKLNAMNTKDKNVIDNFSRNWWHPINSKLDCYRNNNI